MKKETLEKRTKIANDIMYYIYTHIETNIDIEELSIDLEISKFHMHRVFKEIFGRNIYESIKSIRLQKASNLLLTNRYSTISSIVNSCGYSSQSSFIKIFKDRFGMSPKEWKNGGYKEYSNEIIKQSKFAMKSKASFDNITPTIVKMKAIESYYIRNRGYNKNIEETWQKLQTWVLTNNIKQYKRAALFHDNPTITPLDECQYIACIIVDDDKIFVISKTISKSSLSLISSSLNPNLYAILMADCLSITNIFSPEIVPFICCNDTRCSTSKFNSLDK